MPCAPYRPPRSGGDRAWEGFQAERVPTSRPRQESTLGAADCESMGPPPCVKVNYVYRLNRISAKVPVQRSHGRLSISELSISLFSRGGSRREPDASQPGKRTNGFKTIASWRFHAPGRHSYGMVALSRRLSRRQLQL